MPAQVKAIYQRYLELGSVDVLRQKLAAEGVRSKSRVTRAGKTIGGATFSRGALYHLLSNLHYRGMIRHKDQQHAGLHPAIIEEALFDAVSVSWRRSGSGAAATASGRPPRA